MLRELTFKDYHMLLRDICHYMFALACMILKYVQTVYPIIELVLISTYPRHNMEYSKTTIKCTNNIEN